MSNPSGLSDSEELELVRVLQAQPDFECLPIPAYWFKKYNIAPREATGPREYIESNYAMKKANEPKELPPIIIDEPQQGGKVYPVAPAEDIKVDVVSRPFNWTGDKPFPAVFVPTEEEATNSIKHTIHSEGRGLLSNLSAQSPEFQVYTNHSAPCREWCGGPVGSETDRPALAPIRLSTIAPMDGYPCHTPTHAETEPETQPSEHRSQSRCE